MITVKATPTTTTTSKPTTTQPGPTTTTQGSTTTADHTCPGGSLADCINLCPPNPPNVYQDCVNECINLCS